MEELQRLGARTIPVVSQGDKFVFAQVIKDVVDFLGLKDDTAPTLSPDQLKKRYDHVLETAIRLVKSMPDEHLEKSCRIVRVRGACCCIMSSKSQQHFSIWKRQASSSATKTWWVRRRMT
jgi:hypothetical protein